MMTIDCNLGALLAAAIDYGACLGRLSCDLEPSDVQQTQAALKAARDRMVELRKALWEPEIEPAKVLVWSAGGLMDAEQRVALWDRWKEEGDARPGHD